MRKEELQDKKILVLIDIICDICGESCRDTMNMNYEYLDLSVNWGYDSKHDGEFWTAQICETCTLELIAPLVKFNIIQQF